MKKNGYTVKNENFVAAMVIAGVFLVTAAVTLLAIYFG